MFRKKDDGTPLDTTSDDAEATNSSASLASAASAVASSQPASSTAATPSSASFSAPRAATPASAPDTSRFAPSQSAYRPASDASAARRPATPAQSAEKSNQRVLTVGNNILLKGEIATCDRLVIEGTVEATLKDVHTVEIAETGSFKGTAEIENAEISGLFEGQLTVRGRLVIYSSGKVRGNITYGEIEIERGGELTGEIKISSGNSASKSKTPAQTEAA